MTTEDDAADENELREAQALAAALDGEAAHDALGPAPEDALATAALLRHAGAAGELSPERAAAVLEDVLAATPARPRSTLLRLAPYALGGALAAAAALVLMLARDTRAPAPEHTASREAPAARARTLPAPPPALLAAQADLARGDADADARFDVQMRDYRGALFQSLERSYPAALGRLEPARRSRSPR